MNLPSANRNAINGASPAGTGNTVPAIFDDRIVLPIYKLADIPSDPKGSFIYRKDDGFGWRQYCEYRRGFKNSHNAIITPD